MKKEDYEPLVKRTLADFDFGTVHNCMTVLDWKWGLGDESHIPSIGELYQTAERLLVRAAQKEFSCSSGGFVAFSDGTSVELCFTVAEADCSIYELEETAPSNP